MKWFRDLKIGVKLLSSFLVVAAIAAVIGAIGIAELNSIHKSVEEISQDALPSVRSLLIIKEANTSAKTAERTMFSQPGVQETYEKEAGNIKNSFVRADEAIAEYEKLPKTKEEAALWEEYKTYLDKWKTDQDEFLRLAGELQNTDPQNKEAVNLLVEKMKYQTLSVTSESYKTTWESINELVEMSIKAAEEADVHAEETKASAEKMLLIIIFSGLAAAVALGIFISKSISTPIRMLEQDAEKLALGDVAVELRIDSKDEIGSLAKALQKMIEGIREQALAAEQIADGNLTVDVNVRSANDLLGKKLHEMVQSNNEIMSNIASAAEQVAVGSKQISNSSISLSEGTTEQASSIEELTASIEEISSQTELNAQNANQANKLAEDAKSNAVQGNAQMKDMLKAMEEINESSANISKIIKVIDDIAFQTNILALNAAVEAARAGQHGKGFAVVAEEVRNLAARSANAAKETTDMIEGSIKKAEGGTRIAKETAGALSSIVTEIEKVANLVNDIAIASNEQASGISQINQGIMQVSQVVQANSATSEESAAASEELSGQAMLLKETVSRFKLRKNVSTYSKVETLSPEVLKMLDSMADSNRKNPGFENEGFREIAAPKKKIALSDQEFGKY